MKSVEGIAKALEFVIFFLAQKRASADINGRLLNPDVPCIILVLTCPVWFFFPVILFPSTFSSPLNFSFAGFSPLRDKIL